MKRILERIDIRSLVAGIIIGLFAGLALFSALVPSGIDAIRVFNLQKYRNMRDGNIEVDNQVGRK